MFSAKRLNPYYLFLTLALSVSAVSSLIAHFAHRYPLAAAASLDLILTVPIAWYYFLVRPGFRSKATLGFVTLLGLWRAASLFPDVVPGKIWIGGCLELAISIAVIAGFRASHKSEPVENLDPVDRLRSIFTRFTSSRVVAKVIASEFSVFYYAFGWKLKPHVPFGTCAFSMHERSGANLIVGCIAAVSLVEIVPVHLILANRWSLTAAWVATGLSLWGTALLVAISRAFAVRPMLVSTEGIVVRYGLLFRLHIPVECIQSIELATSLPLGVKVVPKDSPASVYIRFNQSLDAELILGFTKKTKGIGISADDSAGLASALQKLLKAGQESSANRNT